VDVGGNGSIDGASARVVQCWLEGEASMRGLEAVDSAKGGGDSDTAAAITS
jgi:hypothetical protein